MGEPDRRIREPLIADLRRLRPGALVVQELSIPGGFADLVAVDDRLVEAWEIKSEADSLARLPGQVASYGAVFNLCTLVVASAHLIHATPLLPTWWGIVTPENGILRAGGENPEARPIRLLWQSEILPLAKRLGLWAECRAAASRRAEEQRAQARAGGWSADRIKPRVDRWIAEPLLEQRADIAALIGSTMRARQGWRDEAGRSVRGAQLRELRAALRARHSR